MSGTGDTGATSAGADWVLISLDEKLARRQGVPLRVPVPKKEFEDLAEKGMGVENMRKWTAQFMAAAPKDAGWRAENAALMKGLEAFIGKQELWQKAQSAFAANDYKKALQTLRMIATVDPDDHAAKMNMAQALANMGDHAKAMEQMEAIRATFTGDADFHVAIGQLELATGDAQKAADEMGLALEANPSCKPAMDMLVKLGVLVSVYENPRDASSLVYLLKDRIKDAMVEEWDKEKRDAAFYLEQLAYHESERRWDVALEAADRAIAAGGDAKLAERARMGRIAALRATGKLDDARKEIASELGKSPAPAWAHVENAQLLFADGKKDEGRTELDRALETDPSDMTALLLRFWPPNPKDIAELQSCVPGLADFAKAHPNAAGAWRSLAQAKNGVGASDEACELYAKAVGLAPEDDDLRAEYWATLSHLKRFDDVLKDAGGVKDLAKRDWKLRWNEAEAYRGAGKQVEARGAFSALNLDESLHVEVRRRAKRAVQSMG